MTLAWIAAVVSAALVALSLVAGRRKTGEGGGVGGKVTDEFPRRGRDDYGEGS